MDSMGPTLVLRLNDYKIEPRYQGFVFAIQPATLLLSLFIGPRLVPKWVPLRVTLITSVFIMALAELI